MADMLETGADWLADQMEAHAAQPVTYWRGTDSVALNATIARTEYDAVDEHNVTVRLVAEDFIIRAADLILSGVAIEPKRGDRIKRTIGDDVLVFEVMPVAGEDAWQADEHRKQFRIHTKHVETE